MESQDYRKMRQIIRPGLVLLLGLFLGLLWGCQAKEPPLSPAAASFKQEIKECIDRLVNPLLEPVRKRNTGAINEILKQIEPEAIKLCRMCPFRIGVMAKNGDTLAVYPPRKNAHLDFYQYEVVQSVLKNRKTAQQQLFLQDGSRLYVICVPLLQKERLVGMLALALSAADARSRWGLDEKEFLVLDFNR